MKLQVGIQPEGKEKTVIANYNFKYMYWTMAQHTVNSCPVDVGDMTGSRTISEPTKDSYGSMLALSWHGQNPIPLNYGSERKFIDDNDTVIRRAHCENDEVHIGFEDCTGKVVPATEFKKRAFET
jgi:fumarylacetoacetase